MTIARSAGGRRAATCSALKPPQEMPIIPTAPVHQGCAAIQRDHLERVVVLLLRVLVGATALPSRPCPAGRRAPPRSRDRRTSECIGSSRLRVKSRLRYGRYSSRPRDRLRLGVRRGARSARPADSRRALGSSSSRSRRTRRGNERTTFTRRDLVSAAAPAAQALRPTRSAARGPAARGEAAVEVPAVDDGEPEAARRHRVGLGGLVLVERDLHARYAGPRADLVDRRRGMAVVRPVRAEQHDAVAVAPVVVVEAPAPVAVQLDDGLDPARAVEVDPLVGEAQVALDDAAADRLEVQRARVSAEVRRASRRPSERSRSARGSASTVQ